MSDQTNVPPLPGKDTYTRERMQKIAHLVDEELPANWGYIVICTPLNKDEGRVNYVANCRREDVVKMLRNFLRHAESGPFQTHTNDVV